MNTLRSVSRCMDETFKVETSVKTFKGANQILVLLKNGAFMK